MVLIMPGTYTGFEDVFPYKMAWVISFPRDNGLYSMGLFQETSGGYYGWIEEYRADHPGAIHSVPFLGGGKWVRESEPGEPLPPDVAVEVWKNLTAAP